MEKIYVNTEHIILCVNPSALELDIYSLAHHLQFSTPFTV